MIYIKETQLPTANTIPIPDKYIGVAETNNVEKRIFVLPHKFKGLDLIEESFVFSLQIQPVNQDEPPYAQLLPKEVNEKDIHLTWEITRLHTKEPGSLYSNLLLLNQEGDIVWQSYKFEFVVMDGINATEYVTEQPQPILEQLVMQAGAYAQSAKVESDKAETYAIQTEEMYNTLINLDVGSTSELAKYAFTGVYLNKSTSELVFTNIFNETVAKVKLPAMTGGTDDTSDIEKYELVIEDGVLYQLTNDDSPAIDFGLNIIDGILYQTYDNTETPLVGFEIENGNLYLKGVD